jgi:hypothetical protein
MDDMQKTEKSNFEEDPNKKLDKLLETAAEKGLRLAQKGRVLTQEGQNMADVANATRGAARYIVHIPGIEDSITKWQTSNQQVDSLLVKLDNFLVPPLISGSGIATYDSTSLVGDPRVYIDVSEENHAALSEAITILSDIVSRPIYKEDVVTLMKSLGLDAPQPGKKSPVELFITAHETFTKPVLDSNPIITSLLPMRESIRLTIDFLLKHRREQEKTKNEAEKIGSIGKHLAYDSISAEQINTWASIWYSELDNSLSPSKEEDISRTEWQKRLVRSTLFLKSLLSGIDPAKLRK